MRRTLMWIAAMLSMMFMTASPSKAAANVPAPPTVAGDTSQAVAYPHNWVLNYGSYLASGNIVVSPGWHVNVYAGTPGTVNAALDQLIFQTDCNLVKRHYDTSSGVARLLRITWSSHTAGYFGCKLMWQTDGNMVIYTSVGARWSSGTNRGPTSYSFVLQNNEWSLIYHYESNRWVTVWAVQYG